MADNPSCLHCGQHIFLKLSAALQARDDAAKQLDDGTKTLFDNQEMYCNANGWIYCGRMRQSRHLASILHISACVCLPSSIAADMGLPEGLHRAATALNELMQRNRIVTPPTYSYSQQDRRVRISD